MTDKDIKLKPCPFCGGDDLDYQYGTADREGTPCNVLCADCGATGPWVYIKPNGESATHKVSRMWSRLIGVGLGAGEAGMNDLDKWAACQSGVALHRGAMYWDDRFLRHMPWTLNDARCREKCVEYWKITSQWIGDRGHGKGRYWITMPYLGNLKAVGGSREEAEIACIKAIKEASDE